MSSKKFDNLFSLIRKLKESDGLEIYDTHVHPYDVMGVVLYGDYSINNKKELVYNQCSLNKFSKANAQKPTLQELLKYNSISTRIIKQLFHTTPSVVRSSIINSYTVTGEKQILSEMKSALVDKSVLLPLSPFVETKEINKHFNDDDFIFLGSIDIHNTPIGNIEKEIESQIRNYRIKGIKLHPNLQGFYPQPSQNNSGVSEKLKKLYRTAEKKGLYLLFHSGYSNLLPNSQKLGYNLTQGSSFALLENFCNLDGKSELFENYQITIVLAHLGQYSIVRPNLELVKLLSDKYPHVFFDTAGVSPKLIREAIELIGSKKIVFGSDALYNGILYNLKFCFDAIYKTGKKEVFEEKILNIFGRNFKEKVLK
ncbi:amidohydrolase family protein [Patescibacteria group bacterium]